MKPELCVADNKIFFYCSVCDKVLTRKMDVWKNHINSKIHAKAKYRLNRHDGAATSKKIDNPISLTNDRYIKIMTTDYKNDKTRPKDLCYCKKEWRCWECNDRGYCTQSPPGWDDGYDCNHIDLSEKRYINTPLKGIPEAYGFPGWTFESLYPCKGGYQAAVASATTIQRLWRNRAVIETVECDMCQGMGQQYLCDGVYGDCMECGAGKL